ncbi:MAG: hypothetical protein SNI20_02105 [Rikenellaceae bacterium]
MTKNYLKLLAAAFVLLASVACDDDTSSSDDDLNEDNQDQSSTEDYFATSPFTLAAEEITPISFTLDVDAGSYSDQYYVACTYKSEVDETYEGDIDAMADAFLDDVVGSQLEVTDFTTVDNWKIFRGDSKVDMESAWEVYLNPDEEVVAFVFGVNDYGEMTTKVAWLEVTMESQIDAVDVAPTVELVSSSATEIVVNVTPEDGIVQYLVVAMLWKDFEEETGYYYTTYGDERWNYAAEDMIVVKDNFVNFTSPDNVNLFTGTQQVTLTQFSLNNSIYANETYAVMAFGVDNYGFLQSQVGYLKVETGEAEKVNITFDVVFDDDLRADDGFTFTITPSIDNVWYYVNVYKKADIDAIGGADADPADIEKLFSSYTEIQYDLTYGEQTKTYGYLSSYVYYYVVAFSYNNGITSDITLVEGATGSWNWWE